MASLYLPIEGHAPEEWVCLKVQPCDTGFVVTTERACEETGRDYGRTHAFSTIDDAADYVRRVMMGETD